MKLKFNQKGFTLIELVVVLSIAAFVVSAASMTVITMMRLAPRSSNYAIALRQVQDTGYWISRDVQMSSGNITVNSFDDPTFMTMVQPQLTLPDCTIDYETVVYETEATADGLKRLVRSNQDTGEANVVAEYLSDVSAEYDSVTGILTVTVSAESGDTDVTRIYQAMQRVPTQ
jgi:prepilin-type N-terminal cleavage/methylation domain-containing protein